MSHFCYSNRKFHQVQIKLRTKPMESIIQLFVSKELLEFINTSMVIGVLGTTCLYAKVHNTKNQLLQINSSTTVGCSLLLDPP